MAQQNSFDIVSQVDRAEVMNAINQTMKEVHQRFDFKGSHANVALEEKELVLAAEDETKLRNMNDILQQKPVRVSGRDRDTLQTVIAQLKAKDFAINMQFTNYRSN